MSRTENRKIPAWIGSIIFHAVVLLLVLLWFSLSPEDKSAPGERIADGTILLQASSSTGRHTEASADTQSVESELVAADLIEFSNADLRVLPSTPAVTPGHQNVQPLGGASATNITEAFQQDNLNNAGMGAGEATVQVFGTNGKGTKFVFVFDRSDSMNENGRIRMAKAELVRSLESLKDGHQFNIIFYNHNYQIWRPGRRLIFASEAEKRAAERFIEDITAFVGTHHFQPLKEAIDHRPDVIFFLTDGELQDGPTLAELEALSRANSRGTQINVIQFGSGGYTDSESPALKQLAEQNHGQYRYVKVTSAL